MSVKAGLLLVPFAVAALEGRGYWRLAAEMISSWLGYSR
jgi:hypothetical protein